MPGIGMDLSMSRLGMDFLSDKTVRKVCRCFGIDGKDRKA